MLDLDESGVQLDAAGGLDVEALADYMQGAQAVTGSMLTTADGARAVVLSGVPTVVPAAGQQHALLLLRLAQAEGHNDKGER